MLHGKNFPKNKLVTETGQVFFSFLFPPQSSSSFYPLFYFFQLNIFIDYFGDFTSHTPITVSSWSSHVLDAVGLPRGNHQFLYLLRLLNFPFFIFLKSNKLRCLFFEIIHLSRRGWSDLVLCELTNAYSHPSLSILQKFTCSSQDVGKLTGIYSFLIAFYLGPSFMSAEAGWSQEGPSFFIPR